MSYNITIEVPEHDQICPHCKKVTGHGPATVFAEWNPTYNFGPMFRAAAQTDGGIHDWNGKTVGEVRPLFYAMLDRLQSDPARFRPLEPKNGWGTYDQLVNMMQVYWIPVIERAPSFAVVTVT